MNNIFQNCKLQIDGIVYVLPEEVISLLQQDAVIVDLREALETEIKAFGIEKVAYLPHSEFDNNWGTLPLEKPMILADSVGIWSKKAAFFLQSKGYQVASLAGGFTDWEKDGFPIKAGKYQPLNGPCLCMIKPHERK